MKEKLLIYGKIGLIGAIAGAIIGGVTAIGMEWKNFHIKELMKQIPKDNINNNRPFRNNPRNR